MRIPSRRMPKAAERRPGLLGWLVLGALIAGLLYLVLSNWVVAAIICGLFVIAAANTPIQTGRISQLASLRMGEGICEFARMFNVRQTDTWIIRAVYEEVQAYMDSRFPLRASDRFQEDLGIDPEDLEMVIAQQVAERTGRSLKDMERNPYYGKVNTVGGLVDFFNNQPFS